MSGTDTVTNSENDSKVVGGDFNVMDMQFFAGDEPSGLFTVHGLSWHLVAPGYGTGCVVDPGDLMSASALRTLDSSRVDPVYRHGRGRVTDKMIA